MGTQLSRYAEDGGLFRCRANTTKVSPEAFEAIARTLPVGSVGYEIEAIEGQRWRRRGDGRQEFGDRRPNRGDHALRQVQA